MDHKEIIRCLVERVVVHVQPKSEHVDVTIHWHCGFTSQHEIRRPVASFKQLRDYDQLVKRIGQLRRDGNTFPAIARKLNAEGFVPPRRKGVFRADTVRKLLLQSAMASGINASSSIEPDEWLVPALAHHLDIRPRKVYYWIHRGWVHARRGPGKSPWHVWVDHTEMKRLQKLKTYCKSWAVAGLPELTTPKPQNRKR